MLLFKKIIDFFNFRYDLLLIYIIYSLNLKLIELYNFFKLYNYFK